MMGGNANAFKILELSPFLPNPRLAICRKEHNMDSDAEVVVQYLSKRLVKRKTCAGTDGKDLFRPLLTIVHPRSSSSFLPVFYHVLPMVVRVVLGRMPQVSFFMVTLPFPILHGLLWLTCACGSRRNVLKLQFSRSALCS